MKSHHISLTTRLTTSLDTHRVCYVQSNSTKEGENMAEIVLTYVEIDNIHDAIHEDDEPAEVVEKFCNSCEHWSGVDFQYGDCFRYPKIFVKDYNATCGEHRPKE